MPSAAKFSFRRCSLATGWVLRSSLRDKGPGIANISLAMQDGFSTSGGLGLGLPGVKRLMDEFHLVSNARNRTKVTIKKWKR